MNNEKLYKMEGVERETTINFNAIEKTAEIYSCMRNIWNMCEKAGLQPIKTYYETVNGEKLAVSKTYECPKGWVKIRKPKKCNMTEEQKVVFKERMKRSRKAL